MTIVRDLRPGDAVALLTGGPPATFVVATRHPLHRCLQLVVWKMPDGRWHHDALDERQDVGVVVKPDDAASRETRLREALQPGQARPTRPQMRFPLGGAS